jgi:hypothetical protein
VSVAHALTQETEEMQMQGAGQAGQGNRGAASLAKPSSEQTAKAISMKAIEREIGRPVPFELNHS